MPELYATITVRANDEMHLERVGVQHFLGSKIKPMGHLNHVRYVQLRSLFRYNLEERCVHYKDASNPRTMQRQAPGKVLVLINSRGI